MDEFQCSWCSRSFYFKDGHFCFLEGKPDNEYSESFLDELEKLAEKLEEATRNQDRTSDDFGYSCPRTQVHDIQLNISTESDRNFSTSSFFRGERVTSSPVSPFIIQCHGSSLDVSCFDSHVIAQQRIFEASEESPVNTLVVPDETSQGVFCRADDNLSNPSQDFTSMKDCGWSSLRPVSQRKRKNTSIRDDTIIRRKKENRPTQFIIGKKRSCFDSILVSQMCMKRAGNKGESQETKEYSKIKSISAKVTPIDDCSTSEIATNSLPLGSLADAEAVSVAGPSGIHTQTHRSGKGKRFVCEECGKAFGEKSNLKVHYRKHTGDKPLLCPRCDKRFTEQGNLTRHLRTHTGEQPFECHRCDKKFRRKHHLNDHLRTHTGEKPFACHICSKAFAQKSNLACHLRTHTGEKPYTCKLCGMDFANRSDCNEHYKGEHGGK
ncbi:Zinc finger protein 782 [Araneus ventricosus]|uniref:Zinc finger protein 782 n=1 Tax=Araneus ventricosus TaxID=182803 RepID=A0A4Y2JPS2_ARAVE|nr:Zinc finger protein 782 [Araneus ventricosus]